MHLNHDFNFLTSNFSCLLSFVYQPPTGELMICAIVPTVAAMRLKKEGQLAQMSRDI